MCFSAAASFTVGAALLPTGIYSTLAAVRKKPTAVVLGVIPILFGLQQFSEGLVWQSIHHPTQENLRTHSLIFLFFAIAFWPFWFPFTATLFETNPRKKRFFRWMTFASLFWFFGMYLPIALGDAALLTTQVVQHSIQYHYPDLWIYNYLPRLPLRITYFLMVALPMAFCTESLGKIPGLLLAISAVAALLIYDYAFVSVWCFFAAVLSVCICVIFWKLPKPEM